MKSSNGWADSRKPRHLGRIGLTGLVLAATMGMAACGNDNGNIASPEPTATGEVNGGPGPEVTPTPEDTETAEASPTEEPGTDQPTWDNAPTVEDLPEVESVSWELADEYEGWGQAALTPCQAGTIDAETVLVREFSDETGGWAVIGATMGFASADEATAAREAIVDWYVACDEHAGEEFDAAELWIEPGEIPVADELADAVGDREPVELTGTTVALLSDDTDTGFITSGTLVQVEDRLTWLVSQHEGMDFNCGLVTDDVVEQCPEFAVVNDVGLRLIG